MQARGVGQHPGGEVAQVGRHAALVVLVGEGVLAVPGQGEVDVEARPALVVEGLAHERRVQTALRGGVLHRGLQAEGAVGRVEGLRLAEVDLVLAVHELVVGREGAQPERRAALQQRAHDPVGVGLRAHGVDHREVVDVPLGRPAGGVDVGLQEEELELGADHGDEPEVRERRRGAAHRMARVGRLGLVRDRPLEVGQADRDGRLPRDLDERRRVQAGDHVRVAELAADDGRVAQVGAHDRPAEGQPGAQHVLELGHGDVLAALHAVQVGVGHAHGRDLGRQGGADVLRAGLLREGHRGPRRARPRPAGPARGSCRTSSPLPRRTWIMYPIGAMVYREREGTSRRARRRRAPARRRGAGIRSPRRGHGRTVTDAGRLEPRLDRPELADREAVLALLSRRIAEAWRSFDEPRPEEPPVDDDLARRLREGLPEHGSAPEGVLDDAVRVLDASVSPARPLYLAYIGSTGLEVGVLGEALAATYDVNLATTAGGADLVERQALDWVASFIGYPHAFGAFTSGGMTSNLTALLAARERALPGSRHEGLAGHRGAVYCSEEAHHSVVRAVEAAGLGGAAVRRLGLDDLRRMRPADLDAAIAADVAGGVTPRRRRRERRDDAHRGGRPARRHRRRLRPPRRVAARRRRLRRCPRRPRRPAARSSRASAAPTR